MKIFLKAIVLVLLLTGFWACSKPAVQAQNNIDYYTCTMHPSVHSKVPGKCPICGMDLVPVFKKGLVPAVHSPASETHEFSVPVERQQQIGVTYATVESRSLQKGIRTVGVVASDSRRSWSYTARVDGYVQQLFVASPGEAVEKGAPLLSLYSPELQSAERELLAFKDRNGGVLAGDLAEAAKARLRLWNMSDEQIAALLQRGKPDETLTLLSPFRGVVAKIAARQGDRVKAGDALVEVTDLSSIWVWADFYESELSALRKGAVVQVSSPADPGQVFPGVVAAVEPFVDSEKRTTRVRIDLENPEGLLHPGMYVDALLQPPPVTALAVPVSAIIPTGLRDIAFVDKGGGRLEPREVGLGEKYGGYYAVVGGLKSGERIVNSANFLIDAEAQVQGALKNFGNEEAPAALTESAGGEAHE